MAQDIDSKQFFGRFVVLQFAKKSTRESGENMAVSAAILYLVFCVCNVMNEVGMWPDYRN